MQKLAAILQRNNLRRFRCCRGSWNRRVDATTGKHVGFRHTGIGVWPQAVSARWFCRDLHVVDPVRLVSAKSDHRIRTLDLLKCSLHVLFHSMINVENYKPAEPESQGKVTDYNHHYRVRSYK